MEAIIALLVLVIALLVIFYPLIMYVSIVNLVRRYLKLKIRETEYQLFIFEQQDNVDFRFDEE